MIEQEIDNLKDTNIYYIRIINDQVIVTPCKILEVTKKRIYNNNTHTDTFIVNVVFIDKEGYTLEKTTLDMIFLTESEARTGLNKYIDNKTLELETRKVQILSCKVSEERM